MSNEANQSISIILGEKINFDNIEGLYQQLFAVDPLVVKEVTIDAEDADDIDFSGLQLLLSFFKKMDEVGVSVAWDNLPISLYQTADDIDLCDKLRL